MTEKFDPVKEFTNLRDNITNTLRQAAGVSITKFPAVDVYETDESVVIYTEPILGLVSDSLEVSFENGFLTVSGHSEPVVDAKEVRFLYRELQFGTFSREIQIGADVKAQEASAALKDGRIVITLPKVEIPPSQQIIKVTPAE